MVLKLLAFDSLICIGKQKFHTVSHYCVTKRYQYKVAFPGIPFHHYTTLLPKIIYSTDVSHEIGKFLKDTFLENVVHSLD